MKNKILITFALLTITTTVFAQDYSMSLEGITKVIISAKTTIVIKAHNANTFLLKSTENYRDSEKTKELKNLSIKGNNNTNYGVEVIKDDSFLVVKGLRERRESNLVIHLPKNINISVESLANNEIYIDGFNSEIESINHQGATVLSNVTGPIVAENGNGSIVVIFSKINQSLPTSIVADNGDIDIRIPYNSSVNISSKTPRGEFYSDFDLKLDKKKSTSNNIRFIKGKLNDGGVEISLQNLKGNIYLRKNK